MSTLTHTYKARGAALQLLNDRSDEILLCGAAGTGKSRGCLEKMNMLALHNPGMRGLMVRQTHKSLVESLLPEWEDSVIPELLKTGDVRSYGGSATKPAMYIYRNGSQVVHGGLDDPMKIMSTQYDTAYVQEATQLSITSWEHITIRLRNGRIGFQQLMADCNPDAPTHWLKQRADEGKTKLLTSLHEDNPRIFDENGLLTEYGATYMHRLDNLTGIRYLRFRKGIWAGAEGLIYDEWEPSIHVLEPFAIPSTWRRWWSIDFGYRVFVLQMWAEDDDGRLYLYRELYGSNTMVEDWAKEALRLVTDSDGNWIEPEPQAIVADHDAEGRATFERYIGRSTVLAKKTVLEGLQAVQSRLRKQGDGKPRLFIVKNACVKRDKKLVLAGKPACTEEEVPQYVWNDRTKKEEPLKENDHGCDAKRYIVAHRDLKPKFNIR